MRFSGNYVLHALHPNYDVAPDGKHLAMIKSGDDQTQVIVVVNWLEELWQRLATKR